MLRLIRVPLALSLSLVLASPVLGEDPPSTGKAAVDELIAREQLRSSFEAILEGYLQPAADGDVRVAMGNRAARDFAALGPPAVPYLVNELEQEKLDTYDLSAYALGLLATPASLDALRQAIARAEEDPSRAARSRKVWAAWALGLAGEAEVVRTLIEGRHRVAQMPIHGKVSVIEAVAIQTAPASVPLLLDALEKVVDDEERAPERFVVFRALRRAGDESAAPRIIELLEHDSGLVRTDAANALRSMGTPEAVAALVRVLLTDDDYLVRQAAANSLEYIGAPGHGKAVFEHLKKETGHYTRGDLYRYLAETEPGEALAWLATFHGRPDPKDRRHLVEALALLEGRQAVPLLRKSLLDEDNRVALPAAVALGRLQDVKGLSEAVASGRLAVARMAAEQLAELGAEAAGEVVEKRVLGDLLSSPVKDARAPGRENRWVAFKKMTDALVALERTEAVRGLVAALEGQPEPGVKLQIDRTVRGLRAIRDNGRKVARWVETSQGANRDVRSLAWRQLGRIGTPAAGRALIDAFDGTDDVIDRREILDALGGVPRASARPLLERVLLEPIFDHPHRRGLRDMAAWSARRIGGAAMYDLLEAAARRRDGREAKVLIYAAVLGGEKALPLLADLRRSRLRYLGWKKGNEQERLDWIAARLASGRSIVEVDVPPLKLYFR